MATTWRWATFALTIPIVELALTTGYIHATLGGPLFTLNAVGYAVLAATYGVAALGGDALLGRFGWAPRLALFGYTLATVAGYLVMGPYFTLGWVAKGVEVALLTLIAADLARIYRSPAGLAGAVIGRRPRRTLTRSS
jgi:hypothetical protein